MIFSRLEGMRKIEFKTVTILIFIGLLAMIAASTAQAVCFPDPDVNDDGFVDKADLAIIASSFGKRCGDPEFKSQVDHNYDCVINILDISFVIGNFFKAIPRPPAGSMAVADFDAAGLPDLATIGVKTTQWDWIVMVSIFPGNGDGTFQNQKEFPLWDLPAGTPPFMTVVDLNEDGNSDMIVGSGENLSYGPSLGVLLGNGDGTFQALDPFFTASSINVLLSAVAGDLNRDGHIDLVVPVTQLLGIQSTRGIVSPGIFVFLGNGDGTFDTQGTHQPSHQMSSSLTWLADLNGDNILDLVTGNVSTAQGNGDGTFQVKQTFSPSAVSLEVADVNGDGLFDLVTAVHTGFNDSPELRVILGSGDGTFRAQEQRIVHLPMNGIARSVGVADLNEDGVPDLIAVSDSLENVGFPLPKIRRFLTVVLGNGDGTFQALEPSLIGKEETGLPPSELVVAELNNDRHLDLALPLVLLGNGDGTFDF